MRETVRYGIWAARVEPPIPPEPPPPPSPPDSAEALQRAQYAAETARAEAARLKQQLEEIQRQLPSEEQRVRWAEAERQQQEAEEVRRRKEGEFDSWRHQIEERHNTELAAIRNEAQNNAALSTARETELNDTLIGLAFSGATTWFGPTGKTVMLPDVAKAYFSGHVAVETVPGTNGGKDKRRVIVKDNNGATILDTRSGQPMDFDGAIGQLIESHPQKRELMRGSGRVGSGAAGGHGANGNDIDLTKLKRSDFDNPEVRKAVRSSMDAPGGLKIGPGFDRFTNKS